ncbi:MAG TPA: HEAT repeat domain-containing protein [Gemmataceae bacterium]|jgi:HEAT repeat protein
MKDIASLLLQLQGTDPKKRVQAARILENLALKERTPPPSILEALKQGISIFLAALKDSERLVRLCSVRTLSQLGPFDSEAVAAVVELFHRDAKDEVMREDVLATLGEMGPKALPFLWQLWKTRGLEKHWKIRVLCSAKFIGPEALPLILQGFRMKHSDYWNTVRGSIEFIELQFHYDVIPALRTALNSPKPLLSLNAGGLLMVRCPETSREVVGRVRRFVVHPDKDICEAALRALGRAGDGMEDALPELLTRLKDEEPLIRELAIEGIGRLGPKAREAVPLLADIVLHDPTDRWGYPFSKMAAQALSVIGPEAAEAVPALIQMLQDDRPTAPTGIPNSIFAAHALGSIGPAARSAVPALNELYRRTFPELRHNVANALEHIRGPEPTGNRRLRRFYRRSDSKPGQN